MARLRTECLQSTHFDMHLLSKSEYWPVYDGVVGISIRSTHFGTVSLCPANSILKRFSGQTNGGNISMSRQRLERSEGESEQAEQLASIGERNGENKRASTCSGK